MERLKARDGVIANIATLIDSARAGGAPVVWVQHSDRDNLPRDSDGWQITEDLSEWGAPAPDLVIAHTNLYWQNHRAPGRRDQALPTASIEFGAARR